jgi:hypothetical protein
MIQAPAIKTTRPRIELIGAHLAAAAGKIIINTPNIIPIMAPKLKTK